MIAHTYLGFQVSEIQAFITDAFPSGDDLILDSEVLVVDTDTGKPLPFGTLGKHKKKQQSNAQVWLFLFVRNGCESQITAILRLKSELKSKCKLLGVPFRVRLHHVQRGVAHAKVGNVFL